MILEFLGLPGAGKSTLEHAIIAAMNRSGERFDSREVLVQALIEAQVPIPRSSSLLRKVSTALYKQKLLQSALRIGLAPNEVVNGVLRRAALRVAESAALTQLAAAHQRRVNLSEGLAQHQLAMMAWRGLYGRSEAPLTPAVDSAPRLVLSLDLPAEESARRLAARGRPELWPSRFSDNEIVRAFAEHKQSLDSALQNTPGVQWVRVDALVSEQSWSDIARALLTEFGDYASSGSD